MKVLDKPKAIAIYGLPGAGKGTQAELIARHFGFIHFDTGKFLESFIYHSLHRNSPLVKRQRRLFETGKMLTPSWVLKVVSQKTEKIAKAGWGIVFSGSPRTLLEAKGLLPKLERLYGRKNIIFLTIKIKPETSIHRNSHRLICTICGLPFLFSKETKNFRSKKQCPFCGGRLFQRSLDKPEVIKARITEYNLRTKPIFEELKKRGYQIFNIQGEAPPFKVFERIKRLLAK